MPVLGIASVKPLATRPETVTQMPLSGWPDLLRTVPEICPPLRRLAFMPRVTLPLATRTTVALSVKNGVVTPLYHCDSQLPGSRQPNESESANSTK